MNSDINFSVLISKAVAIFKFGFSKFITLGLIGGFLSILPEILISFGIIPPGFNFILSLIFALINIAITISMLLMARSILDGDDLNIQTAFEKSSQYYLNYFTTSILLGLRLLVLIIPFLIASFFGFNLYVNILMGIIALVCFVYIFLHYGFAPLIRVENPEISSPFSRSYNLVKNARMDVFIYIILVSVFSGIGYISTYIIAPTEIKFVFDLAVYVFTIPFINILSLIFYRELVELNIRNREVDIVE